MMSRSIIPLLLWRLAIGCALLAPSALAEVTARLVMPPRSEGTGVNVNLHTSPRAEATSHTHPAPNPPIHWDDLASPELVDGVEILEVAEGTPAADGQRPVAVRLKYTLGTYPKAALSIGFNTRQADRFSLFATRWVKAGAGVEVLTAVVTPVTWPKGRPFKLVATLSAEVRPSAWSSLATVSEPLVLRPTAGLASAAVTTEAAGATMVLVRRDPVAASRANLADAKPGRP